MNTIPEFLVGDMLRERGLKLVAAESCTGGLIASRITDVPGSSEYFLGGIVAYAYEVKVALLDVPWDTLNSYGAVSRETVMAMSRGARDRLNGDIALSVSGVAGPGGGSLEKPVGTTWIGLSARPTSCAAWISRTRVDPSSRSTSTMAICAANAYVA